MLIVGWTKIEQPRCDGCAKIYLKTQMTPDAELTFDARYTLKRPATETEINDELIRQAAREAQRRASRKADYEALKREFEAKGE